MHFYVKLEKMMLVLKTFCLYLEVISCGRMDMRQLWEISGSTCDVCTVQRWHYCCCGGSTSNCNRTILDFETQFWSPPTLCSIHFSQVATLEDTALFVNNTHWHVEAVTFWTLVHCSIIFLRLYFWLQWVPELSEFLFYIVCLAYVYALMKLCHSDPGY